MIACGENQTHPTHLGYGGGDAGALACVPNLDGAIEERELPVAIGVPVSYLVSPASETRQVDLKGETGADGKLVWNLGTDFATDRTLQIAASTLAGKWYESSFPGGEFTTPLDAAKTLDAIYAHGEGGITLLGIASAQENPPEGKTLIVYATPVLAYKLPLSVGTSWVATGEVMNATVKGLPYAGKDVYEFSDDATGEVVLPSLTFTQAHRLRTHLTSTPSAGQSQSTRQSSFVFECFGEVARATSQPGEMVDDFTTAAELRRLGP